LTKEEKEKRYEHDIIILGEKKKKKFSISIEYSMSPVRQGNQSMRQIMRYSLGVLFY